jgi:hypothetical protein
VTEQLAASITMGMCGERTLGGGGTCIVTDCEAVVKVARSVRLMTHPKSVFAGMWWDRRWDQAWMRKVRSHQPEEVVGLPGEISRADWEGNNMADEWAGKGVPKVVDVKGAGRARHLYTKAGEEATELASMLGKFAGPEWDRIVKGRHELRVRGKAGSGMGHHFVWLEKVKGWACEECGKLKRRARHKCDKETCKARRVKAPGNHPEDKGMDRSHNIWQGWGEEGHPPTNVCMKCGLSSTFRCYRLKLPCRGAFGSEAMRKKLGEGKHPTGGQVLHSWMKVGREGPGWKDLM